MEVTSTPKPTPKPAATPTPKPFEGKLTDISKAKVGDTVKFGSYEQDANTANGKEEIEWYVIDKQGDKVLLLSKYILDAKRYNEEYTSVTWAICTLWSWLNSDFYNTAFTDTEKGYIRQVTLDNPDTPCYGTEGGNATKDRVFLLSLDELRKYFSFGEDYRYYWEYNGDTRLLAHGTRQAYVGSRNGRDAFVFLAGEDVHNLNFSGEGVRPAIWLDLNP